MQIPKEMVRALSFAGCRGVGKISGTNFLLINYEVIHPLVLAHSRYYVDLLNSNVTLP